MKSLRTPQHQELRNQLVSAREKAGLTQTALARVLGRHQSFVAKYEGGERRLEVMEFVQICKAIGLRPDKVLRDIM